LKNTTNEENRDHDSQNLLNLIIAILSYQFIQKKEDFRSTNRTHALFEIRALALARPISYYSNLMNPVQIDFKNGYKKCRSKFKEAKGFNIDKIDRAVFRLIFISKAQEICQRIYLELTLPN
jgi:hypothetical protein